MLSNRINRLAPPPRAVPLPVVAAAMTGVTGLIGGIFLIAGLLFTIVFTQGYRPFADLQLDFSSAAAQGTVTRVIETNSSENDVYVYEYAFTFVTGEGGEENGRSYTTGQQWSRGDRVTVDYVPSNPSIARIRGARLSEFAPWVLFVLIFPVVGLAMFGWGAVGGLRQVQLLSEGEVADARITSQRPTNVSVNNVPVVEYSYEITTTAGVTYEGKAKSLPKERIGDEEAEPALYLPSDPYRSTLVDAISLSHQLDVDEATGRWIGQESWLKFGLYLGTWAAALILGGYWLLAILGFFG